MNRLISLAAVVVIFTGFSSIYANNSDVDRYNRKLIIPNAAKLWKGSLVVKNGSKAVRITDARESEDEGFLKIHAESDDYLDRSVPVAANRVCQGLGFDYASSYKTKVVSQKKGEKPAKLMYASGSSKEILFMSTYVRGTYRRFKYIVCEGAAYVYQESKKDTKFPPYHRGTDGSYVIYHAADRIFRVEPKFENERFQSQYSYLRTRTEICRYFIRNENPNVDADKFSSSRDVPIYYYTFRNLDPTTAVPTSFKVANIGISEALSIVDMEAINIEALIGVGFYRSIVCSP